LKRPRFPRINFLLIPVAHHGNQTELDEILCLRCFHSLSLLMFYLGENPAFIIVCVYSGILLSLSIGSAASFIIGFYVRFVPINDFIKYACTIPLTQRFLSNFYLRTKFHQSKEKLSTLLSLHEIYSQMIDEVVATSFCFGSQAALSLVLIWIYTLFTSFTVYKALLDPEAFNNQVIFNVLFCLYLDFYAICVFVACYLSTYEHRRSLQLLNRTINATKSSRERRILMTFIDNVRKRPPIFTCGLFDFDLKLVASAIGAITTNFLILMQFDAKE